MNVPLALVDYDSSAENSDSKEENEVRKFSSGKRGRGQEEEEEENKELRRKKQVAKQDLPPLPSEFLELFTVERKKEIDDTNKHEGRIRTVPHVEGNWATHVFVEMKIDRGFDDIIQKIKNKAQNVISQEGRDFKIYSCIERDEDKRKIEEENLESKSPGENEIDILDSSSNYPSYTLYEAAATDDADTRSLHISLSRPIFLKYHQIKSFWEKIRNAVQDSKRFSLSFAKIEHFVNDEKTRSFLALEVGKGYNEIPRFHASILWWSPGDTATALCDSIIAAAAAYGDKIREEIFIIDSIRCKIGNKEFTQNLL